MIGFSYLTFDLKFIFIQIKLQPYCTFIVRVSKAIKLSAEAIKFI